MVIAPLPGSEVLVQRMGGWTRADGALCRLSLDAARRHARACPL